MSIIVTVLTMAYQAQHYSISSALVRFLEKSGGGKDGPGQGYLDFSSELQVVHLWHVSLLQIQCWSLIKIVSFLSSMMIIVCLGNSSTYCDQQEPSYHCYSKTDGISLPYPGIVMSDKNLYIRKLVKKDTNKKPLIIFKNISNMPH